MGISSMLEIGPAPKKTIETQSWDNFRSQVVKIFISHGDKIYGLQFQYFENEALVLGEVHGNLTGPYFNIVNLNYPSEYITGLKGSSSIDQPQCIQNLAFETNLRLHGLFGGSPGLYNKKPEFCFDLGKDRRQFGGFHGNLNSSNTISTIGVYLNPIMELGPQVNENNDNAASTENVKVED